MSELTDKTDIELLTAALTARFSGAGTEEIQAEALRRVKEAYGLTSASETEEVRLQQHKLQANLDEIRHKCRRIVDEVDGIYDELGEIREDQGL